MLQIAKQVIGSSPRDRTNGEGLQNASKIHLAVSLESTPAKPCCHTLQLRSCSAKPGTNVRNMSRQVFQLVYNKRRGSGFAPLRGGFEHRGADPSIIGMGPPRDRIEAAEASSSMTMTCLQCTQIII